MKTFQFLKLAFILTAIIILLGTFTLQAHGAETTEAVSIDIDTPSTVTSGDIQTSTATLEETSWKVKVLSTSGMMGWFQISSAILTFSNGQLTISNWIYNLDPALYYEHPADSVISFTATLKKQGTIPPQIFHVVGATTDDGKIVGLLYNFNSGMMMMRKNYVFWGEPLVAQDP